MRHSVWTILAVALLRDIEVKKDAYNNLVRRLERLRENFVSVKGPTLSTTPVQGGQLNKEEERILNNMAEREELEISADILKSEIEAFEVAWNQLSKNNQTILTYFFVNKPHNHVDKLMEIMNLEKTRIYEIRDDAVCQFALRRYGKY